LGRNPKLQKSSVKKIDEKLNAVAYRKSIVRNACNQLDLKFKGGYTVEFRAYDNGVAYRFVTDIKGNGIIVDNEQCEFNFPDGCSSYQAYSNRGGTVEEQFSNSFESQYEHTALNAMNKNRLVFLPFVVETPSNVKVTVSEANQFDYPGMFVRNAESNNTVKGVFANYPKEMKQGGHNNLQMMVKSRESYIAKVNGKRSFPWRVMGISTSDKDMTDNDIIFCLAEECKLDDTSWIKPGKVAWDWWNDWNISGVDFKSGVNNDTYKYYIDFASKYGIEYVILDEGWAVNGLADMMRVVPEIDLPMLVDYAKSKNVGIILWGGYKAMDKDMENLCKHYSEMGVKGFKVDFMDRDDQLVVDFYNRMARVAAKYKLIIDFHGAFKPSGMNRTYPNVINYEGSVRA
jgi:Glycoside hydrolase 97.